MPPYAALNHACLDKQVICCQQFIVHIERSAGRGKKKKSTKETNKKPLENACSEIQASLKLFAFKDELTCFYCLFMTSCF